MTTDLAPAPPLLNGSWSTVKRIIATIVAAAFLFLAGAVLNNSNRITAVETRIEGVYREIQGISHQLEKSRVEARDECKDIVRRLDDIAKEVRR